MSNVRPIPGAFREITDPGKGVTTEQRPQEQRGGRQPFISSRLARALVPWLFLFPALVLLILFKFIPMFEGIRYSFFEVRPFLGNTWVGFDNYVAVMTDSRFQDAIGHTVILAVGQTIGAVTIGLLLALLLEGASRSLHFVRTAVFLPVVTATAVVAELWRLLYYPAEGGFLNSIVGIFGLGPFPYIDSPDTALGSVMAVMIWTAAPYNMVILLAGLTGVDRSLYEAGAIDGVSIWQRLRYITLPALRPAMAIVLTLAAIRSLRTFTEVWVLTAGGPAGSTEVWMTRVYKLGFERNDIGVASAASVMLLLSIILLTLVVRYATRRKEAL